MFHRPTCLVMPHWYHRYSSQIKAIKLQPKKNTDTFKYIKVKIFGPGKWSRPSSVSGLWDPYFRRRKLMPLP